MKYRAVWHGDNGKIYGNFTDKDSAFEEVKTLRKFDRVAWVEDELHNKIAEMTVHEILDREA